MNVYIFQAALLCEDCTRKLEARIHDTVVPVSGEIPEDSDKYPQGPYGQGGGEADCPQHCDHCGVFLENPLTDDGAEYVKDRIACYESVDDDKDVAPWSLIADRAEDDGKPVLAEWVRFYFAPGM